MVVPVHTDPRIAILLPPWFPFQAADVLRGVTQYLRRRARPYRIVLGYNRMSPTDQVLAGVSGVLINNHRSEDISHLAQLGIPIVSMSDDLQALGIHSVCPNEAAIGRVAAEHLIHRGYTSLAFCGWEVGFARQRLGGFRAAVPAGMPLSIFGGEQERLPGFDELKERSSEMVTWLAQLPAPTGILAVNDDVAALVLGAAERAGLTVPGQVGVVGVDNNELVCDLPRVSVSSVDRYMERIAFEAAGVLDLLLQGRSDVPMLTTVAPLGVFDRASTAGAETGDAALDRALTFMRAKACEGVRVEEVARFAGVTRRTLERRHRQRVGLSVKESLDNVRLAHARQLLIGTDLPLSVVAARCGFHYLSHFSHAFKRRQKCSPSLYRRDHRLDSPRLSDAPAAAG